MEERSSGSPRPLSRSLAEHFERVQRQCKTDSLEDLVVEENESVILSYASKRFQSCYREVIPQSADEVRELMGVSEAVAEQVRSGAGGCGCRKGSRVVGEADLVAENPDTRGRALSLTRAALREYIMGGARVSASQKSVFDRYVAITKPIMHLVLLQDIVVHDGATLTVAKDTHSVLARNIRIHGSGRIVCEGPTTFNCTSVQGDYGQGPVYVAAQVPFQARPL